VPFTAIILATILFYTWILEPRGVPAAVPAAVVVCATLANNFRSGVWGLSPAPLLAASRAAAIFTTAAVPLVLAVGLGLGTLHDRPALLANLAGLIPWGGAQQWVLQTVVLSEARRLTSPPKSIVLAAALFSVAHAPNVFLMLVTFVGALGWCAIFTRYPNFMPLAVSHAVATLALLYAFDDDVTGRLRIGQAYLRLDR
jgi:hypothetical protein